MKLNNNIPETLYHYCSCKNFYNIIQTQSLYLNDIGETNDYLEHKYIDHLIHPILHSYEQKGEHGNYFIDFIKKNYILNRNSPNFFVSFSEKRDCLSQWRGYADDGCGFSIGFNPLEFNIENKIPWMSIVDKDTVGLIKLFYSNEDEISILINKVLENAWEKFELNEFKPNAISPEIISNLIYLTVSCKNPAFKEEQEWRILYTPLYFMKADGSYQITGNYKKIEFYIKNKSVLSSYFSHKFNQSKNKQFIKNVILGPKNRSNLDTIKNFLSDNNFKNVTVEYSLASYRSFR